MAIISSLLSLFTTFNGGPRLIDGGELGAFAKLTLSTQPAVTAKAGGGQAGATPLNAAVNPVSVVATNADSVLLPLALPGTQVVVYNATANTLQVFGQASNPNLANSAGDRIVPHDSNSVAASATGVSQATALIATYVCYAPGLWKQMLSA